MVDRRRWRQVSGILVAAVAATAFAGCSGSDDEPVRTIQGDTPSGIVYVGRVDASNALIGLVAKDDELAGMVCENANASVRLDAVPIQNGAAELKQDGRVVGTVSVANDLAVGTVAFAGSKRKFIAEPATEDGAGVFRKATGDPAKWDGWVVLNDGTFTGTSKAKPTTGRPWIEPDIDP